MKKLLLLITIGFLISFNTQKEKTFTISFTEAELSNTYTMLANVQIIVDKSNLPHDQVKYVINGLDSLMLKMRLQYQKQIADTSKKK